jgi:hypothetical protein
MPKRRVLAFGEYGGVASTICNNLIADLLFLRKCHAPAQSLLRLGPRSWVFAPAFLKSKLANVAVCPCGTALHSGAPGVLRTPRRGVGAPMGAPFSSSFFCRREAGPQKIFERKYITNFASRRERKGQAPRRISSPLPAGSKSKRPP